MLPHNCPSAIQNNKRPSGPHLIGGGSGGGVSRNVMGVMSVPISIATALRMRNRPSMRAPYIIAALGAMFLSVSASAQGLAPGSGDAPLTLNILRNTPLNTPLNLGTGAFNGWPVSLGLAPGSIALLTGGANYAAGDSITLGCTGTTFTTAPVVTVTSVSAGAVTGAVVANSGAAASVTSGCTLKQTATSGSGSGATWSGTFAPIAAGINFAALTTGSSGPYNGSVFLGAETPSSTLGGAENTFVGDRAGGTWTGASKANTFTGHDAGGLFGSTPPSGNYNSFYGNDAVRNACGNLNANTVVGQGAAENLGPNAGYNTIIGQGAAGNATSCGVTGIYNLIVGQNNAASLLGGNNNVIIGSNGEAPLDVINGGGTNYELNIGGLLFEKISTTAAPTVSACGTSPSVDSHANLRMGTVTIGSGNPTSCTITLPTAFNSFNHCAVWAETAQSIGYSYTLSVLTVTGASLSGKLDYLCEGY